MCEKARSTSLIYICLALLLIGQTAFVHAATFYVDPKHPKASDTNSGSRNAPWLSLYPTTQEFFSAGDTIIVGAGVYTRAPGSHTLAMINPRTSGRRNKPITFISRPRYAAILDGQGSGSAVISLSARDYIVIDGFKIMDPGSTGISVRGKVKRPAYGIAIQNNYISGVDNKSFIQDTDGIRFRHVVQSKILNNKIYGIKDSALTDNVAAIKLYNSDRIGIENNDLTRASNGIIVKAYASNISIKRNFFGNVEIGIKLSNANKARLSDFKISHNIFKNSELAVQLISDGGTIERVDLKNNVFANYSVAALQTSQADISKIKLWNNIFARGKSDAEFIADVITYDDPSVSISKMDYNLYTRQPIIINGLYKTNRRLFSLNHWSRYSEHDRHSIVATAKFVNSKRNNFRLRDSSVGISSGRLNGVSADKKVNLGAYESNTTIIGFQRNRKKGRSLAMKKLAKKKRVVRKSTRPVFKKKKVARKATQPAFKKKKVVKKRSPTVKPKPVKQKQTLASRAEFIKPESKPTNITSRETQPATETTASKKNPIVVALAYPDAKPRRNVSMKRLEWDVRNALKFNGACVLESNKIYFYDGYDDASLKFRLLNDKLYLLTRSNIDISFKDIGMQVGANSLVRADRVVNDQTVVIRKNLPKLLSQLRKSKTAKIQLRFWPTYPATQTYSEHIKLDGFQQAYQAYKACKQGN